MEVDDAALMQVDGALREWRQGDCVIGEHWFLFRLDPAAPITEEANAAAADGLDAAEAEVRGLMLTSQTCDIVRSCRDRPYVEVCPLVEVEPERLEEIRRCCRPRYAYVPGLHEMALVADLDRSMTVEKAVVAKWDRTLGWRDDDDIRRLSLALARKRARFAFPDDFAEFARDLQKRLILKHDKDSDEGRALRAMREIRVRAAPSWDSPHVRLTFWFVRQDDDIEFEGRGWDHYLAAWLGRLKKNDRFQDFSGLVTTLDDLTARDYVESDPLDLDRLSD